MFRQPNKSYLEDLRNQHKTVPPTRWFIAKTDAGRVLKIIFVDLGTDQRLKSAFEPNQFEVSIYDRHAI